MTKNIHHRLSILLAISTLILIFFGGLVTSTDSGLAVPDWPLSFGRIMPPMVGGIFFEHGHRLVASFVGFLTILMLTAIMIWENQSWVKKLAWGALALVIFQGVLGGVTVLLGLKKSISVVHACLAQGFFILTVSLAVWTSSSWKNTVLPREEEKNQTPLHHLAFALLIGFYFQLVLGALIRHLGKGLLLHAINPFLLLILLGAIFYRMNYAHSQNKTLWKILILLLVTFIGQVILGVVSYLLVAFPTPSLSSPWISVPLRTTHVFVGAFLLGLSTLFSLWAYRTRPTDNTVSPKKRWPSFIDLTKPRISFMTGVSALAGYILGTSGNIEWGRLLHTVIGTCLVSGGACALNMFLERDVDSKMKRTENRPIPSKRIQPGEGFLFGVLLSIVGLFYLITQVNILTAFLAGITLSIYLYLYTPLKKITVLCTAIGAVSGAIPPMMGWTAATGSLGKGAWILFGILFFWQFPHFYSLAWLYRKDYAQAGFQMLPSIEESGDITAGKIVLNSFALLGVSLFPSLVGLTGPVYFISALSLGLMMTLLGSIFFFDRTILKAKRLFLASVLYLPLLILIMILDHQHLL